MKPIRIVILILIVGLLIFYNCTPSSQPELRCDIEEDDVLVKITEDFNWIKDHLESAEYFSKCREYDIEIIKIADSNQELLGSLILTSPNSMSSDGFGGEIDLGIIIDPELNIIGLEVIDHSETRSYLNRVKESGYLKKFKGLSLSEELVFDETVEAVSGATYTSKGIFNGILNVKYILAEDDREAPVKKKEQFFNLFIKLTGSGQV